MQHSESLLQLTHTTILCCRSLPLSLPHTHTHTNHRVFLPPPHHDHNLKHPRLKTAFFFFSSGQHRCKGMTMAMLFFFLFKRICKVRCSRNLTQGRKKNIYTCEASFSQGHARCTRNLKTSSLEWKESTIIVTSDTFWCEWMLSIHCKVVLLLVAGQPDSLPAHTVIYFFYFLCSITFEACRNQKQTRPDMRRQTHLAAQTPVWPSCNWLNCSWTWRETRSDPPSQETTLRLWISHISKAEGGNRRTYKEGSSFSLSHASAVRPPSRAGSGTET